MAAKNPAWPRDFYVPYKIYLFAPLYLISYGYLAGHYGCDDSSTLCPACSTPREKGYLQMKRIDAVIRPSRLEQVKERLHAVGITGLTIFEARGFGRQKGHTETYRGAEYSFDFLPKLFLSLVVVEELLEPALGAIIESARTGVIGDGKIFVTSLDEVVRIRTGERGPAAI